jgi:hypothetical protein
MLEPMKTSYAIVRSDSRVPLANAAPIMAPDKETAERKAKASGMHTIDTKVVEAAHTAFQRQTFAQVIRVIQMLPVFDRIQVAMLAGVPFGTASAYIAHLEKAGYVSKTGGRVVYDRSEFEGEKLNYSRASLPVVGSIEMRKTKAWKRLVEYMQCT